MPPIETLDLYQRALLWAKSGTSDEGLPTVGDPEEIDVRWEVREQESYDPQSATISPSSKAVVDRAIAAGSLMWLAPDSSYSALEQWNGTGSGAADGEVHEVVRYSEVPDIKNRAVLRTVGLARAPRSRIP